MGDSSQARLPAITAADNAEERTAQINSIRDHAARISRVPGPGSDPIWIDGDGFVIDWHPAAAALLGLSAQHLKRDLALMFIVGRPHRYQLTLAMHSRMEEFDGVIRPRERRGVPTRCRIEPSPTDTPFHPSLRWTFTPRAA